MPYTGKKAERVTGFTSGAHFMKRFPSTAGIAIGPILFILAILGILALVFSSGSSSFGVAQTADRVKSDVGSQANLIRSKINECYMQNLTTAVNNSSAPCSGIDPCPVACQDDAYPCSDQTNGTAVTALTCPGDSLVGGVQQNIWTGSRNAMLPPPTSGFSAWTYMNAGAAGGRCFWTAPTAGKSATSQAGLGAVAAKFSTQEISYQSDSNSQKFVVFVTLPTGAVDSHCAVP
jgi:hypothetical protein